MEGGTLSRIIIKEVAEGGAGGEAQVRTQFRNIFPGIGGTVRIQQPMMAAWREEFNQSPGVGRRIFLKHLILKKLDDYFCRTGRYLFPHIARPLGSGGKENGLPEGYWYQWVYGQETFPWEYPKTDGGRDKVSLDEWSQFTFAFAEAGINLSTDVCDADNGLISQNIIHEFYKFSETDLNFCWKRIDFGAGSMRMDFGKLCDFLRAHAVFLGEVLGTERLALLILAGSYLSRKTPCESCLELDELTAKYRLSSLRQNTAEIFLP